MRFRYLYPAVAIESNDGFVAMTPRRGQENAEDLGQQFLFCLYRQKIYAETLSIRRTLIDGVTGA